MLSMAAWMPIRRLKELLSDMISTLILSILEEVRGLIIIIVAIVLFGTFFLYLQPLSETSAGFLVPIEQITIDILQILMDAPSSVLLALLVVCGVIMCYR